MPELTVPLPLWIASQVVGFLGIAAAIISFQIKHKKKMLLLVALSNILIAISAALLKNWVVCALIGLSALRGLIFAFLEHRRELGKEASKATQLSLMFAFMIASIISVIFTWEWWFDWVLLATSLFIIYGNYAKGIHLIRIGFVSYDSLAIVNYIKFFNIIGIIQSILLLSAMGIFYIKFFAAKKKDKASKNYVIIHGSFGDKNGNWFPWLKGEIEQRGFKCELKQFPIGIGNQNFDSWSKVLAGIPLNKETIIFAHSSAPIFVIKYMMQNKIKIAKLISVSGFNSTIGNADYDEVNSTFLIPQIKNFENFCTKRICIYSDNDPYVNLSFAEKFADEIKAEKIIIANGGHLNKESGFTEFPELLNYL